MKSIKERLFSKLRPGENDCLLFTGAQSSSGYGNLYTHSEGRRTFTTGAHRAAYEIAHGPIPDGMMVLHKCDVPACCNPEHLFLGNQADNMRDKAEKGRAQPGPAADPNWWTSERIEKQSITTKTNNQARRSAAAKAAGFSDADKLCPTCKTWKPRTAYGLNKARPDGIQAHCKACKNAATIERRRRKSGLTKRNKTRSDKKHFN